MGTTETPSTPPLWTMLGWLLEEENMGTIESVTATQDNIALAFQASPAVLPGGGRASTNNATLPPSEEPRHVVEAPGEGRRLEPFQPKTTGARVEKRKPNPGRSGPLPEPKRQQVRETRERGACIKCRWMKKEVRTCIPCSNDPALIA